MVRPSIDFSGVNLRAGIPSNFTVPAGTFANGIFSAIVFDASMMVYDVTITIHASGSISVLSNEDVSGLTLRVLGYIIDE